MTALLDAQSAVGSTSTASLSPSAALKNLFSQIDANGNGQISKSEFENALGAGGTNIARADKVFSDLDTNGDGSVSLNELKSALQGAGGHHGHHFHVDGSSDGADSAANSVTSSYNWIEQMIQRQAQALSANAGYSLSLSA
jgi:Ca2+-binding EF-hand superfamily protein